MNYSLKKLYILVAEDDEDDRHLLQVAFDENGYKEKVEFVVNGAELMVRLNSLASINAEADLPSFILLDLNMPRKDGREALLEIKAHNLLKKIPVIVFSAAENIAEIKRCYESGANSYVIKPSTYSGLLKIVQTMHNYWLETAAIPA